MSHFLGRVVKLIKEHKSNSDAEKKQLDRFEEHVQVFILMEKVLETKEDIMVVNSNGETTIERKERIERDKANIQRVDAQTRRNDA